MTDAEILAKVKAGIGVTGTFQDDTLMTYIDEVKGFLIAAGVDASVTNSAAAVGCIIRGVSDLWNYSSGSGKLSEYFKMRVLQLKSVGVFDE